MLKVINKIPTKPGIYKFYDKSRKLLYIGKAKNLKSRVKSYFAKSSDLSPAKEIMVSNIKKIEFTIVNNEKEALLLESSLIKKYKPMYNIDLKDDKSWLYIKITNAKYPQVVVTRKLKTNLKLKEKYFGPYTSGKSVKKTIKLLRKIFPYFTKLGPMIELGKKTGSPYHLGRYLEQESLTQKEWLETTKQVERFLNGKTNTILKSLKSKMKQASIRKEYEKAGRYRDQIQAINNVTQNQTVILPNNSNEDYLNIYINKDLAVVTILKIRQGKLIDQQNFTLKNVKDQKDSDILEQFISRYYLETTDLPKVINIPFNLKETLIKTNKPIKGNKKKLLNLSFTNAKHYYVTNLTSWQKQTHTTDNVLKKLKKVLNLKNMPLRIEGYDISNIQGVMATGSMVVFTNARPNKKEYRRFSIKTFDQANDPGMMSEVIQRRQKHTNWTKPELILIDGGRPQLNAASKHVKNIPIISIAKREEEIYQPHKKNTLKLSKNNEVLKLLQRIRDEAHRFAITGYKIKHTKANKESKLDNIPGIGPKTKKILLKKYGSLNEVNKLSNKELILLIGKNKAKIIKDNI
ncbi:excinuclease ABC subunit UvrC [bacterium]|jgi:excinuclease ABC subunit C|nr:excinuclease ABC subunit UvrC [bacterium]MBT4763807.1 excinuclease ABC subunit UvrC [bacterium]MBT5401177.1 excinuclease ABC subunit UvrC [bacterium]MBT5942863.1 excinuclease ABC subunit UvrC [bacterium]MBT6067843.1 excinuclease ABC subunit UvrC [bacterium]